MHVHIRKYYTYQNVIADVKADVLNFQQWSNTHVVVLLFSLVSAACRGHHRRCDNEAAQVRP